MKFQPVKKIKRNPLKTIFASLLLMFLSLTAFAQQSLPPSPDQQNIKEDYSETVLKEFVDANKVATKVQQESQNEMLQVIESEGLDVNTFNQIMTAKQDPNQELKVSESELDKFNNAAGKVMALQKEMQVEVVKAIETTGMDPNTYDEIMLAYQKSPKVQEKVHKILEKNP